MTLRLLSEPTVYREASGIEYGPRLGELMMSSKAEPALCVLCVLCVLYGVTTCRATMKN